jgi:hypothetical protein
MNDAGVVLARLTNIRNLSGTCMNVILVLNKNEAAGQAMGED